MLFETGEISIRYHNRRDDIIIITIILMNIDSLLEDSRVNFICRDIGGLVNGGPGDDLSLEGFGGTIFGFWRDSCFEANFQAFKRDQPLD